MRPEQNRLHGVIVGGSMVAIMVLTYFAELWQLDGAPVLRFLYLVPIFYASVFYGRNVGLLVAFTAVSLFVPILLRSLRTRESMLSAEAIELWITIGLFPVAAYFAATAVGRLARQRERYRLLNAIGEQLALASTEQQLLESAVTAAMDALEAAGGEVLLYNPATGQLSVAAQCGLDEPALTDRPDSLGQQVLRSGPGLMLNALELDPGYVRVGPGPEINSLIAARINGSTHPLGVIAVANHRRGPFEESELALLEAIADKLHLALTGLRLRHEQIEQERLQRELALGRQVQARFLPQSPPVLDGYMIAGASVSAREVGGDFYTYLPLPDARYAIAVGDVAGAGIEGAFYMAISTSLISIAVAELQAGQPPLAHLNALFCRQLGTQRVNTALCLARLDPRSSTVHIGNAGLIAPLLYRAGDGRCRYLDAHGLPLGAMPDARYFEETVILEPGDVLVLPSDGVVEAFDTADQMYGLERLRHVTGEHAHLDPAELRDALFADVRAFVGTAEPHDDMTIVIIKKL